MGNEVRKIRVLADSKSDKPLGILTVNGVISDDRSVSEASVMGGSDAVDRYLDEKPPRVELVTPAMEEKAVKSTKKSKGKGKGESK